MVVVVCFCATAPVLVWWGHATEASEWHPQTRNQLETGFSDASSNAYVALAKLTFYLATVLEFKSFDQNNQIDLNHRCD